MSGKALTILTVLALLCAPLAAQDAEDPMQEAPQYEPATETEVSAEATLQGDVEGDVSALDEEASDEELPRTASPLALLALLGGAGVASGLGLRLRRRR